MIRTKKQLLKFIEKHNARSVNVIPMRAGMHYYVTINHTFCQHISIELIKKLREEQIAFPLLQYTIDINKLKEKEGGTR